VTLRRAGSAGQIRLDAITTEDITKFRDELFSKGLSAYTVNLNVERFEASFKLAVDEGWIQRNPVASVRQIRGSTAEKGVFTRSKSPYSSKLLRMMERNDPGRLLHGR